MIVFNLTEKRQNDKIHKIQLKSYLELIHSF